MRRFATLGPRAHARRLRLQYLVEPAVHHRHPTLRPDRRLPRTCCGRRATAWRAAAADAAAGRRLARPAAARRRRCRTWSSRATCSRRPEQPVPGSPLNLGTEPAEGQGDAIAAARGDAWQLDAARLEPAGLAPLPPQQPITALRRRRTAMPGPPAPGQVVQTEPRGTGVTTGGTQGYQTMTMPGGGTRSWCRTATAPAP